MYHKYQNIIKLKWEHLEITIKEEDLEVMTETIKEMAKPQNLILTIVLIQISKETFQAETIIMHLN